MQQASYMRLYRADWPERKYARRQETVHYRNWPAANVKVGLSAGHVDANAGTMFSWSDEVQKWEMPYSIQLLIVPVIRVHCFLIHCWSPNVSLTVNSGKMSPCEWETKFSSPLLQADLWFCCTQSDADYLLIHLLHSWWHAHDLVVSVNLFLYLRSYIITEWINHVYK